MNSRTPSRRHSSRNSKIVNSDRRASAIAISIADLSISATAPLFDPVAPHASLGLGRGQREAELLFHGARQEPPHAVLLPICRLHHLFDAGPLGPPQQREHALLLRHS